MKRLLFLVLSVSSLMAVDPTTALVRTQNGFNLHIGGTCREVKSYDVDSRLKSLNNDQLGRVAAMGCLRARELNNGDYRVEIGGGLKGGGLLGAKIGAIAGKWGTYIVGHGVIIVASALTGPACLATFISLEAQLAAPIEAASNVVAIAGGLAGAVATGPV